MEEKVNIFIAFLDDDGQKREDWAILLKKETSYVEIIYRGKIITIPWHRVLKLKEDLK